jgi:chromosome segregation ATPase
LKNCNRIASLSLLFALVGCASQGSLEQVRSDVEAIKPRLISVERDLGGTREQSTERLASLQKGFKADVASVRTLSTSMQGNIDVLRADLHLLGGRVEDNALSTGKSMSLLETRIGALEERADKSLAGIEERLAKLQASLDDFNKRAGAPPRVENPQSPQ